MPRLVAALLWLTLAVPVFGQEPLDVAAALDEAISSNPELLALRREAPPDRVTALVRASAILAAVRQAHVELALARAASELYEGQAPMMKEMSDALTLSLGPSDMLRHDTSTMSMDIARLALGRSTAREQVRVAEVRFNAAVGRRLEAPVGPLATPDVTTAPTDAAAIALARDPRLGGAGGATGGDRDTITTAVRRRVLEAVARVEGARERAMIMTTSVLPQVELGFERARAAYTANQGGFLEMLDAHHRQVEARIEYAAVDAAYKRALVELDIAMGETPERLARAAATAVGEK
jgi:outer membrane protein TolC